MNKLNLTKTSLAVFIAMSTLVSCGGEDAPDPEEIPNRAAVNDTTVADISGSAIKGTLSNADVSVTQMNGSEITITSDHLTDSIGTVSFTVQGDAGFGIDSMFKILVTAQSDTTMMCDAISCAGTELGKSFSGSPLTGSQLTTLTYVNVPYKNASDSTADANFQANALTTIATSLIEKAVAEGKNVSARPLYELALSEFSTYTLKGIGVFSPKSNIFDMALISAESYDNFVTKTECETVPSVDENEDPILDGNGDTVTEEICVDTLVDIDLIKVSLANAAFANISEFETFNAVYDEAVSRTQAALSGDEAVLKPLRERLFSSVQAVPFLEKLGVTAEEVINVELAFLDNVSSGGPVQEITTTDNLVGAIITARNRIGDGEAETMAFDGDINTKWLDHNDWAGAPTVENPAWIQIQFEQAYAVNSLFITSANDADGRDPENFTVIASKDGVTWVTLADFIGESFDERFERKEFRFSNGIAYSYYKVNITKNKGDDTLMQLAEIQLVGPIYASVDHTNPIGTGTITARNRIGDGEAETMAFDNNSETKWLDHNDWAGAPTVENPAWVQVDFSTAIAVNTLAITSANDADGRDPENFTLVGSNDVGTTWVELGSWIGESFDNRFERKTFSVDNLLAFSSYRLNITKNKGDDTLMQLAEIELIGPEVAGLNHGMTAGSVITARNRIGEGEAETMAFDGDVATKWLDHNDWAGAPTVENPAWVQVELQLAVVVNKLGMVSANDADSRDPENFDLLASNDGTTWLVLNSWIGESFDERAERKQFSFGNDLSFRFYRLNITKNKGDDTLMQVAEIELIGPQYVSEDISSTSGVVVTDRNRISDAEAGTMVFDNDVATKWLDHNDWAGAPTVENPAWVQIDLPEARIVSSIAITSANDADVRDPENFNLEGSNDAGATWQTVSSWIGESWDNRFERKLFEMGNGFAYTSYRINITKNKGDDTLMQIAEIELIGPCLQAGEDISHGLAICESQSNVVIQTLNGSTQKKTAYIEVNDHDLANVGCFMEEDEQLFDTAVIFAANMNYDDQIQSPIIHLNNQVTTLLDDNIEKVQVLQAKGIKVILDILGNHQDAGWACFVDEQEAGDFADLVKLTVDKYNLDGIDIDDEYSTCATNDDSLIKVSKAIKDIMPDKLLTKALFSDNAYFNASWNNITLGEQLDYGWEMSYENTSCTARLNQYVNAGVDLNKLGVGASTVLTSANTAKELAACAMDNGFNGGMMIFNVTNNSLSYLQKIWKDVTAKPSCLS